MKTRPSVDEKCKGYEGYDLLNKRSVDSNELVEIYSKIQDQPK